MLAATPHLALRAYAADVDVLALDELDEFDAQPVQAVIVPGARVFASGQPSGALGARIEGAAAVLDTGLAYGAFASGAPDEAPVIAALLSDHPVTSDPEGLSTTETCQNAYASGVRRAIVVTQPRHQLRTGALCKMAGIEVTVVATPHPHERLARKPRRILRERAAEVKAFAELLIPFW